MAIKVRIFLDNQLIPENKLHTLVINNKTANRIVNSVVERQYEIVNDDETFDKKDDE